MFTLEFSKEDMARILRKLNGGLQQAGSYKFKWKIKLLNKYARVIATAMGSVSGSSGSGRNGYPVLSFEGITGVGHWNALRPSTIRRKLREQDPNVKLPTKISELYQQYGAKVSIWLDTGDAKSRVTATETFAGIPNSGNRQKFQTMETGGLNDKGYKVAPRPLFSAANFLVLQLIHNACQDPNHPLGQQMRQEFYQLVKAQGWGS